MKRSLFFFINLLNLWVAGVGSSVLINILEELQPYLAQKELKHITAGSADVFLTYAYITSVTK